MKYIFSTERFLKDNTKGYMVKDYSSLTKEEFDRLLSIYTILSDNGIYPKIYVNEMEISCKEITPLAVGDETTFGHPRLPFSELEKKIDEKIALMHSLDLAHGDLCIYNIGYIDDEIYFMNVDYAFKISEGMTEHVKGLMDEGFEWEETFDEFVSYDFNNWKLCLDGEMKKACTHPPK